MASHGNLTFNRCFQTELKVISDLAHQIWPITFAEILSKDQIDFMLNWMYHPDTLRKQQNDGHLFFLIKDHLKPIGFVGLELNVPRKKTMRIHKIYLLPSYQGQKIGAWMIEKIEELALLEGLEILNLNVNRWNKAVAFYQKRGFETIEEIDIPIGNGFYMNDFVMEKKLNMQNS